MKIIFKKQDLINSLETVQRAAQSKVTSNTNNGFFIAAKDNKVEFQANDYIVGIKTYCKAQIEEEGITVIAAPQLLSTIRMIPSEEITMEIKKNETLVTFKAGQYIAKFPTRLHDDFPEILNMQNTSKATLKCKDLVEMTNLVQYSAANDKQKPLFTGILFEIKDKKFIMAATNTHRLAVKEIELEENTNGEARIIVPAAIMTDVVKLLPEGEDEKVEITWAKNHVAFTFNNTYFITSLINGEYPDYKRVIPSHFDAKAELDLNEFIDAVRFVSPISRDVNYQTINFFFSNDKLEIYEEDPDIGKSDTTIPLKLEGENIEITFNCTYIEDILKHSKGEKIILNLIKNGPMLVEQESDKTYKYVVTPMRGR